MGYRLAVVLLVCAACTGSGDEDAPGGGDAGARAGGGGAGGNAGASANGGSRAPNGGRGGASGASAGTGVGGSAHEGAGRDGGGSGSAGTSSTDDAGAASAGRGGSGASAGPSELPVPPGAGDAPVPSAGSGPNLRVLPWAGWKAAASYTFDDSQPSHVAHFEAIADTGARVTWYLNTTNSWIADYDATWMKALALGHELGNHTVHHCYADLSGCDGALASIDAELDECSAYIEDTLGGGPVLSMAYPFGDTGYAEHARSRFPLARGTGNGMVQAEGDTDPFDLPVVAAAGGEDAAVFESSLDAAQTEGAWVIFLFHSLLPTDQNWYAGVELTSVTDSIAHAQSLSDVWLDSVAHVGVYWLGARAIADASTEAAGAGMTYSWELPAHFPSGAFARVVIDGGELRQGGELLPWDGHGYYEVALDARELAWSP